MDKQKIREWLKDSDGYGILDPDYFREMGIPEERVRSLCRAFSSDPSLGKNAAHRNDGSPGDVEGVSEFAAVRAVASLLGVDITSPYYGRGKNFDLHRAAVLKAIES